MGRIFALVGILASMAVLVAAQAVPASVTLTWLGQSTFVMSTSTGLKALIDPTNPGAYTPSPVGGLDVVTVSHEHPDHNYLQLATGSPLVLRGLASNEYATIDQTIKGVRVRTVPTYHDPQQGAQRGKNAVFVFEVGGLRVVHLGDLGQALDAQQASRIGSVDVLMIPVAGGPTIDAKTALDVVDQLKAKVIIPMHYSTAAMTAKAMPAGGKVPMFGPVDDFLKLVGPSAKVEQAGHTIELTAGKLPSQRTVMVMKYE
jgi:L-ascorbate metabolism protein UlaG (beta-lactamase superfamily)